MGLEDVDAVAGALQLSIGLFLRRIRQVQGDGELTMPESSALPRLDKFGPTTSSELARSEQISPQSMGATLGALEDRGLIERRPDPTDGRRVVLSPTEAGVAVLRDRRDARSARIAAALEADFTAAERRKLMAAAPLIERLAHTI